MRAAQFARNQLPHARQTVCRRGVGGEKLFGETHRTEGQADGLLNSLVFGRGEFATSAAEVEQQHTATRTGFSAGDSQVNEPALFEAGIISMFQPVSALTQA